MGLDRVKLGFTTPSVPPARIEDAAFATEAAGCDEFVTAEARYDPFIGLAVAARATERVALRTGIAVAFARNPMNTAIMANDLQLLSRGRFSLGLGTQIKAHVTRRFSMPWNRPIAQMRDYIAAIKAIWVSFETGKRLRYRGEFYRHTLMNQFFNPGPNPYGMPPILLGGVGRAMTELAGEIAGGFIAHNICTRRFLDEVTLPSLLRGRALVGMSMDGFDLHLIPMVATGRDEPELRAAIKRAREQVAFYTATPTYSDLLELHGLSDLRSELHRLTSEGRTDECAAVIDDGVLETFAFVGEPKDVAVRLMASFGDIATGLCFYDSGVTDPAHWIPLYEALRELQADGSPRNRTADREPSTQ